MEKKQSKLNVEFSYLPVVTFAMQQNRVSVIQDLFIENLTEETLEDLRIKVRAEPEFATSIPVFVEAIRAKEKIRAETPRLRLLAPYFARLAGRVSADISLHIYSKEELLFEETYPVHVSGYEGR